MLPPFSKFAAISALALCVSAKQLEQCAVGGDASVVALTGTPVGTEQVVSGINMYISEPASSAPVTDTAVLFLTDVFGINLTESRLLADSFARAGFLTIAPDLFNGQPAPSDLNNGSFNSSAFLAAHGPEVTDPIVETAITYLREDLNVSKIAVTGYCFGGRYAFRFVNPARTLKADVAFAAHPSAWTDADISAIGGPVSVANADGDALMPPARRAHLESLLLNISSPYQTSLYSGVPHGFGVRINITNPVQVWGKESAFLQAVRWFSTFQSL